jgi:tetratricopeptide (TPR) repeat protein
MGVVYRAQDKWSGTVCAVKVLEASTNARRFLREAQILAKLTHPGIVRYVGHGVSPTGALFLAMEWVEGTDLERRLAESPLTVQEALEVGCRLAETLEAVHAAGIVHRDLKPSNVFLPQGRLELAKLGDFGIAHLSATRHATSTLTRTGVVVGTPGYLSPEQLRAGSIDARADLFGLGCVLFECLTGRPAFWADSLLALLAKIALDATPRVSDARPELPLGLDALVSALLEKEPEARPQSAAEVRSLLEAARRAERDRDTLAQPRTLLGTQELRLVPIMVCPSQVGERADTEAQRPLPRAQLELIARSAGVRVELLPDGSLIGVPDLVSESPKEQALRAARLAQMLVSAFGARPMALVTGRMAVSSGLSVSEVVDRALSLISSAPPLSIVVDEASASLLEPRFAVERAGELFRLGQEVLEEHGPRRLLGRQTPFVGRQREFSLLFSTLEACLEEAYARSMLVSGLPGIGKSRLLSELLTEARSRFPRLRLLVARGDPALAGQPFSLLGGALRRSAEIRVDDGVDARVEKLRVWGALSNSEAPATLAFLGEIMGLELPDSFEPRLRAARRDPPLMSALTRSAFVDWVRAASAERGLLLALDDLHWGDGPSVQLVDAALGELPNAPLFVLALGRPEVKEIYPRLFEARDVAELKLGRLSKRASEELVAAILGDAASAALVSAIVERAEGNAFFLEELIRAGASGGLTELPDTVLGVMESRLSELETEARLVLRAASVFGESCWPSGVASVLGPESAIADVPGWLFALASREILVRTPLSRFAEQAEYGFRHALLRDASYATFPELDRKQAHARAATWLETHGEGAAIVLANHWERALDIPRATRALVQAVEQALRGNDLDSAIALGERAEKMGASGEQLGRVRLLESEAYTWMGVPDQALRTASQAIELSPKRDAAWYTALATAVEAAMLVGDPEAVQRLVSELQPSQPEVTPDARESRAAALGRISFALVLLGRAAEAEALLVEADRITRESDGLEPMTLAHLSHARAARAMVLRKVESAAQLFAEAAEGFEQSGALRLASGARTNVAAMYLEMGANEQALEALERASSAAERVGARYTLSLARLNRGIALGRLGKLTQAAEVLGEVRAELERQGDRRLMASAACALSEVLLDSGRLEEAETEATRAVAATEGLASSHAAALATLALVLLGKGDVASALSTARSADAERRQATMEEREVLLDLVLSEAERAVGELDSARARIVRVATELGRRAEELVSPELRRDFLERVPEHRKALALCATLTGST